MSAILSNLLRKMKSLWATSPTFQAIVIVPTIGAGGWALLWLALAAF